MLPVSIRGLLRLMRRSFNHCCKPATYFSILLLLVGPIFAKTAAAADDDFQSWVALIAMGPIADTDWRGFMEFQPRFGQDGQDLERFILRPAIGRYVGSGLTLYQGYMYQPIQTTRSFRYNWKNEHRSYQELRGDHTLPNGWPLLNRFRFEQRFIDGVSPEPALRARHLVRTVVPVTGPLGIGLWDELFWNMNDTDVGPQSGFDQNRAFLTLVYKAEHNVTYEGGYMHNWVHQARQLDRQNHVMFLSAIYRW